MSTVSTKTDQRWLNQPSTRRHMRRPRPHDSDSFGRFAEAFARYMGTAQFIVGMTVLIVVWISWNTLAPAPLRFDRPWFILLNLLFSTQASYAAPLILLAQNRQDDRDRVAIAADRRRDERNLASTEYLNVELESVRMSLQSLATRDFVRSELRSSRAGLDEAETRQVVQDELAGVNARLDQLFALLERQSGAPAPGLSGVEPVRWGGAEDPRKTGCPSGR